MRHCWASRVYIEGAARIRTCTKVVVYALQPESWIKSIILITARQEKSLAGHDAIMEYVRRVLESTKPIGIEFLC